MRYLAITLVSIPLLAGKLASRTKRPDANPFIEENACRNYTMTARTRLEPRVADERK